MNQETKKCQNCKKDFVIETDDFTFYEKMGVQPPVSCPDCRFKIRA
ncbi:MAG: zinc-ribbon domain containing protein [Candidatus Staskawiczbacteria bacterium]|nr:zinc-ribbon domain containing protein [Candidatus Staskawiczbacteria bacterium]